MLNASVWATHLPLYASAMARGEKTYFVYMSASISRWMEGQGKGRSSFQKRAAWLNRENNK